MDPKVSNNQFLITRHQLLSCWINCIESAIINRSITIPYFIGYCAACARWCVFVGSLLCLKKEEARREWEKSFDEKNIGAEYLATRPVQRDNRATELQMNEINKIKWSEDYSSFLFFPSFFDPETKVSRAQSKEINLFIAPFDPSTFLEFWKTGARHLRHSIFLLLLSFPCPISSQEDR